METELASDGRISNNSRRHNGTDLGLEHSLESNHKESESRDMGADGSSSSEEEFEEGRAVSGGLIVSERPIFLGNSALCVVNNRKCTLYSQKDGKRICDTYFNPEMIISCRSFVWKNMHEILLCSSSDGSIYGYHVPDDMDLEASEESRRTKSELKVVFQVKVECKNLLAVETEKSSGEILCVVVTKEIKTEVIKFTLDYSSILFSDDKAPIYVRKGDTVINGSENGLNSQQKASDDNRIKELKTVVSMEAMPEVFEVDAEMRKMAIGVGKSVILVEIKEGKVKYFENENVVTCMAFDRTGKLTLGDSLGQIMVVSEVKGAEKVKNGQMAEVGSFNGTMLEYNLSDRSVDLITLSKDYNTQLRELNTLQEYRKVNVETKKLHWHSHSVNCMSYYKDLLLSGGEEGVVVLWDLTTNSKKFVTRLGSPVFFVGGSQDQKIFASMQNNTIWLIDFQSLSLVSKITSLSVNVNYNRNQVGEKRILEYYPEFEENKRIVKKLKRFKSIQNKERDQEDDDGEGVTRVTPTRNKIIVGNQDILQVYDYVGDKESARLDISRINYVSRQDQEFGQTYDVTNVCVSEEGRYLVVAQSRSLSIAEGTEEDPGEEQRKYVLKFYEKTEQRDIAKQSKDKENIYEIQTIITNPHEKKITGIKEIRKKNKFVTVSLDGRIKVYGLVEKEGKEAGSEGSRDSKEDRQVKRTWICTRVTNYKNMEIHSMAINDNNIMALRHESVLTLWKFPDENSQEITLIKAITNPLEKEIKWMEFANNDVMVLATNREIYTYEIKFQKKNLVLALREYEELCDLECKYGLMGVNIRRQLNNGNYVTSVELYRVGRETSRIYSKLQKGLNASFSIRIVPSPFAPVRVREGETRESLTESVLKRERKTYRLLILNECNCEIETVSVSVRGEDYRVNDRWKNEIKYGKVEKQEEKMDFLWKFMENLIEESRRNPKQRKGKFNLVNRCFKKNNPKYKKISMRDIVDPSLSSTSLPKANVLVNQIINKLI